MERESWNQFVLVNGTRSGRFLQSWEWGEFQKAVGEQVERKVYESEGSVIGVAQWTRRKVGVFGTYALCQKGPIMIKATPLYPLFDRELRVERPLGRGGITQTPLLSKEEQGEVAGSPFFLRIEPIFPVFVPSARKTINLNPADTLITVLSCGEDELLAAMHPKTRYNIGVAKRHNVETDLDSRDFESVWELFCETSYRGQFRLHPRRYYETMLASLRGFSCRAFLATAKVESKILAANIIIDFGDTRTYLHGASSNQDRNAMAPYLLHWELMLNAKARGLRFYDWWGVAPKTNSPPCPRGGQGGWECNERIHPWSGISRFKRGFGGEEVSAPGTYDIVTKPFVYYFYRVARHIAKTTRNFCKHP